MADLAAELRPLTERFSGVVSVSRHGAVVFEAAYGLADRAHEVVNTVNTRFAVASATKGFTAVTVAGLITDGCFQLSTPVRAVLGTDLPLIDDAVTVEHLLAHTSGIGDYLEEEADGSVDDYVLSVPVHTLGTTEGYVAALDGFGQKFEPGHGFAYSNAGYVVLALVAERLTGCPFPGLVGERVFGPAEMWSSAFLRSDRLPGDAAVGYLDDGRTNTLHLPVRGSGDGGAYSTAADLRSFWAALFDGRLLDPERVHELIRARIDVPTAKMRCGLGFWLHPIGPAVVLEGGDPGVTFRSVHDPTRGRTHTVVGNTSSGALAISRRLDVLLR